MAKYEFEDIIAKIDLSFYVLLISLSINICIVGYCIMTQNNNLLSNVKQIQKAMNIYNVEKE